MGVCKARKRPQVRRVDLGRHSVVRLDELCAVDRQVVEVAFRWPNGDERGHVCETDFEYWTRAENVTLTRAT